MLTGHKVLACDAVPQGTINKALRPVGEELNYLRENIKEIEEELHHVKKRLNFTRINGISEKREDIEGTGRQYEIEETVNQNKERKEGVTEDLPRAKPLKEGAKKVAKAACQCVCFVSKAVSNVVKTCYGKLRSLCCKSK